MVSLSPHQVVSAVRRRLPGATPEGVVPPASETVESTPEQRRRERRRRLRAMSLTELAEEFGTDKWGVHRYTPHYERHLQHLRGESSPCSRSGSAATPGASAAGRR